MRITTYLRILFSYWVLQPIMRTITYYSAPRAAPPPAPKPKKQVRFADLPPQTEAKRSSKPFPKAIPKAIPKPSPRKPDSRTWSTATQINGKTARPEPVLVARGLSYMGAAMDAKKEAKKHAARKAPAPAPVIRQRYPPQPVFVQHETTRSRGRDPSRLDGRLVNGGQWYDWERRTTKRTNVWL